MLKSFVCLQLDFILSNRSLRLFLVVEHWDRLAGSHNFGYSEIAEDSFGYFSLLVSALNVESTCCELCFRPEEEFLQAKVAKWALA
jgi:hypothetical protein